MTDHTGKGVILATLIVVLSALAAGCGDGPINPGAPPPNIVGTYAGDVLVTGGSTAGVGTTGAAVLRLAAGDTIFGGTVTVDSTVTGGMPTPIVSSPSPNAILTYWGHWTRTSDGTTSPFYGYLYDPPEGVNGDILFAVYLPGMEPRQQDVGPWVLDPACGIVQIIGVGAWGGSTVTFQWNDQCGNTYTFTGTR